MKGLAHLRARLEALRWARAAVRWGNALALLVTVLLVSWGLACALDVTLHWNRWLRGAVLVVWGTGLAAVLHRWIWPEVRTSESLEQVALIVEREHGIDSDLIAALQFDGNQSPVCGSPRLASAVVEYVAEFSHSLDVFRGFSWQPLPRRTGTAAILAGIAACSLMLYPAHAAAFWNRFWLGTARYPTRTQLIELTVNGRPVPWQSSVPEELAIPQDQPVTLAVQLAGDIPAQVTAEVQGEETQEVALWTFAAREPKTFAFTAPRLSESMQLTVRAGDAESDPVHIRVVPLPLVELQWSVIPPDYARETVIADTPAGARTFSALQGSQLRLSVQPINKPLAAVQLKLNNRTLPLAPVDPAAGSSWQLPGTADLGELQETLRYELQVVDTDGLSLQPAIQGEIRLHPDRIPRVAAAVVSRKVLPTATPALTYGASDDFGLQNLSWKLEIVKADGARRTLEQPIWTSQSHPRERQVRGSIDVPLKDLQLAKGDELRLIVTARDDRGKFPPGEGVSEPLILEVTDRNGILESLLEIDQQSARQLDEIIERELGIGRLAP